MKKTILRAMLLAAALTLLPAAPVLRQRQTITAEAAETKTEDHWEKPYYIKNGTKAKGLQKIDGKLYYFNTKTGKLVTNKRAYKIKANGKTAYYNIDKKGVATKWTGTAAKAAKRLVALKANLNTVTSKTKLASLKKAFLWSAKLGYVNNTKNGLSTKNALKYYGDYGFDRKKGDCNTQAATFYWMAKVLGYDATYVKGYVPTAKGSNGKPSKFRAHAWVEIKIGSKTYAFDPNFNTSSDARSQKAKNTYVGFKFKYGAKGTYWYHNSKKKSLV